MHATVIINLQKIEINAVTINRRYISYNLFTTKFIIWKSLYLLFVTVCYSL